MALGGGFDSALREQLRPDQGVESACGVDRLHVMTIFCVTRWVELLEGGLHGPKSHSATAKKGSIDVEEHDHGIQSTAPQTVFAASAASQRASDPSGHSLPCSM